MATRKQTQAARENVKKAQKAATRKRTIANLPSETRRDLGRQAALSRQRGGVAGHRLEDRTRSQLYDLRAAGHPRALQDGEVGSHRGPPRAVTLDRCPPAIPSRAGSRCVAPYFLTSAWGPQDTMMLIFVPAGTVAPVREVCALMWNFLNFFDGCLDQVPSWQPALRKAVTRLCDVCFERARHDARQRQGRLNGRGRRQDLGGRGAPAVGEARSSGAASPAPCGTSLHPHRASCSERHRLGASWTIADALVVLRVVVAGRRVLDQ